MFVAVRRDGWSRVDHRRREGDVRLGDGSRTDLRGRSICVTRCKVAITSGKKLVQLSDLAES